MNKKIVLIKLLGLLLIIGSFIYNQYNLVRFIVFLVGLLLLVLGIILNNRKNTLKMILKILISIIAFYGIDFLLVKYFNHIPIISLKIESSNNVATYNSLFYRLYECDKDYVFDSNYKKNYACEIILPEENINSLLSNIANNFSNYHNKFVNINGKISGIDGSNSITMQAFENGKNNINGEVSFSDNIILTIMNNGNLEKVEDLKIFDTINVIGRIEKIIDNNQSKEIIIEDAKIISRNDYTNYEINVIQNKKCEVDLKLMGKTEEYTFYNSCLDTIYVKYDNENIYDLGYVLTDKRMTFEMLTKDIEKTENEINELYEYDEFNILKCKDSNNVIIGNKKLNLDTNYCDSFEIIENIDELEGI